MKFKFFLPFILIFLSGFFVQAQTPTRATIKGVLQDTLKQPVPFATVMLLNAADSALINFTSSNDKGEFAFNNVKNSAYLFKVQHMSYLPFQKPLTPSASNINNLGLVTMKPISLMLMEVVIKAAKAPLRMRGDTVEYDATTFKVPPGSTVEDLLRRLPGLDVDADGNISTQGKDVKRLYVDGKTFFGDDPKSVTKNLGAEAISKVQVYNEKSEQSQLTGIDDGSKEKAMNLELKDEFKKGSFGKITVAAGTKAETTEHRLAGRGNFNRFNDKTQLSFIGYGNNINQTGVNWEDYGEFKGNNSFNDYDNGDFGFNSSGGRMYYFSSEDSPVSYYDGKGLTENFGGGTNFNYDHKGTKFNSSYFYNQTKLEYDQTSLRRTFLSENSTYTKHDTLNNSDFRSSHSIGTRFEREFDSSNKLIVKANFRFSSNTNKVIDLQQLSDFTLQPQSKIDLTNGLNLDSYKITTAAIYRHLFKKKGRSFAVSAGFNTNVGNGNETNNSITTFFDATTPTSQIRQLVNNDKNVKEMKGSLLYTEPLSKKFYVETFYNFSQLTNNNNRQAFEAQPQIHIDSLSKYYEQLTLYNRLGTVVRYSYNGLNASIGIAALQLQLTGNYAPDKGMPWDTIGGVTKSYLDFTPNLSFNYEFKNHMRMDLSYTNDISAPEFSDLQPIKNTRNPIYLIVGNPDLIPEISHNIDFGTNYWNPASFANIGLGVRYGITEHPIVYTQTITLNPDSTIINISTPENMDRSTNVGSWLWSNFPIIKTKLALEVNGGFSASNTPTRINGLLDNTKSRSGNIGIGINFTPGTKLVLSVGTDAGLNKIRYTNNESQDQDYYNYSINSSVKWNFISKMFFESNFNYSVYRNEKYGFDESLPLWNASVRRILGKKNKFEMRFAAFDIFNKNMDINQYASQNYIETSKANTLARYFMLSLTYNMKGFENKLQKNRFW